jgi:hypothetical protein
LTEELAAIAENYRNSTYPSTIRALFGVTLLARAAPRLGFTVRSRPLNLHGRLERFFLQGLLAIYSSQGLARLAYGVEGYNLSPQEVWMPLATLLERYGPPLAS